MIAEVLVVTVVPFLSRGFLKEKKIRIKDHRDHKFQNLTENPIFTNKTLFGNFFDKSFYAKVDKDLILTNQKLVKETIQDLIFKQELPATAQNLIITTPTTSRINFKPKIHKPQNHKQSRPTHCFCMQLPN